jgi:RNase P subunit RPR2
MKDNLAEEKERGLYKDPLRLNCNFCRGNFYVEARDFNERLGTMDRDCVLIYCPTCIQLKRFLEEPDGKR